MINISSSVMSSPLIAVIGLGYVGLPLAVEFARKYRVVGFDIKQERVAELLGGNDATLEISCEVLQLQWFRWWRRWSWWRSGRKWNYGKL